MLILYVLILSAITFAAFGWDKFCAMRDLSRIPERTLLALAAIGGTPGAFAGRSLFRHKTRKQPFVTHLLLIAAAQAAVLVVLGVSSGGALLALFLI